MKIFAVRKSVGCILFILLVISGCSKIPPVEPYLAEERDTAWIMDINYLEKTLPQVHKNLFFHLSEEEFYRNLEELKMKVPHYSDEEIEIELSVILASIGDTHTGSNLSFEDLYPLKLHWFAEGIYIMGTNEENAALLDGRIISLNGKKIEEVAAELRPILGEANESWFKAQIVYYLPFPAVLQYFGVTSGDEIELEVELAEGLVENVNLKPINYKEYVAAESPERPAPLYQSRPEENYWYEYFEEEKIVYLNYSRCREMREKPFEIFNNEFWDFVNSHEPEKLVVDIRENRGGNSLILNPFLKKLKTSSFNQPGRLYVIIGRDTFSSAVLNAITLKKETSAYFVGEPTGGEPNHYGEVKQFTLPNSKIPIRYSTKYFHWVDGDGKTIEPDKLMEETFANYRQGKDPVLDWIRKQR